jgi:hypothetical protein
MVPFHASCSRRGDYAPLTFKLDHVPQSSQTQQLAILALGEVWYFLVALLEPFVEALCDDDAALLLLHGSPHSTVFYEGVVAAVDRLHLAAVVGVALRPEGDQTWGVVVSAQHMGQIVVTVDRHTPLHLGELVCGLALSTDCCSLLFLVSVLAVMFGTVCSVYEAMVAWGEIVTLSHLVVGGRIVDWHLRVLQLPAHFRGPLRAVSHVMYKRWLRMLTKARTYRPHMLQCLRASRRGESRLLRARSWRRVNDWLRHAATATKNCIVPVMHRSTRLQW